MRVQGKSINDLLATHRVQRTLLKDMSSAGTLCVWREFEDLTNDWALVGKHTLKQCIPDAQRKPQKANITEGVLKSRFWNIDLYRVLPILQFILEQAVSNPLPTVSSVCSGLQLRSVMHQCGESSGSEVRRSASGAGMSSSAFSTAPLSTPLVALLWTQRALWHHQCKINIRVKPPGTKILLALCSAVPVANDSHGSTQ